MDKSIDFKALQSWNILCISLTFDTLKLVKLIDFKDKQDWNIEPHAVISEELKLEKSISVIFWQPINIQLRFFKLL